MRELETVMPYLLDNPRLDTIARDFLRKYGDGRSEAYDDLCQLLASERERGMRDAVTDVVEWFRMPDDEFDRTHVDETRIAHHTANAIERQYLQGTRLSRLMRWDSTAQPIHPDNAGSKGTRVPA